MGETSGNGLIVAIAVYMLTVVAGMAVILAFAPSEQSATLCVSWLSFAGIGGLMGGLWQRTAKVEDQMRKLGNGDLDKRIVEAVDRHSANSEAETHGRRWTDRPLQSPTRRKPT